MTKHAIKCTCSTCIKNPKTWIARKLLRERREWQRLVAPLKEQIERSGRLSAEDLQVRVNV